jgi:hypothetical protein
VHIALETRMTPAEVMALWAGLTTKRKPSWPTRAKRWLLRRATRMRLLRRLSPPATPLWQKKMRAHSKHWISTLLKRVQLAGKPSPVPFVRKRLRHSVSRFEGGGSRRDKTLVVCFTGNAFRMMMPMPVFLQHIDPRKADVVYLRTRRAHGYRAGIQGVGNDLETSIAALEELLEFRSYKRVAMMGTSGGALPALLAGLRTGADAVLAVGANNPNDPRWVDLSNSCGGQELFRRFAAPAARAPNVHLLYGALNKRDEESARAIASCIEVQSVTSVPDADHGCLFPLAERGQLEKLLESTVLSWSAESEFR